MAESLRSPLPQSTRRCLLSVDRLSVFAGDRPIFCDVSLEIPRRSLVAIEGPSGVGKSTFLRCLNRLIDLDPGLRAEGDIRFGAESIFSRRVDANELRRRVGMLFQQPVIFPGSIADNVLFGARHHLRMTSAERSERVEKTLRQVALWPEVRERLDQPASELSVGQQQRLCLARTLAVEPEVLLMDEPTSALDPEATAAIEALLVELRDELAIVLVTHDRAQARRTADLCAVFRFEKAYGVLERFGGQPKPTAERKP